MALFTRLFVALSLSVLVTTPAIAQEPAPASANSSALSEAKKNRLPGKGPHIYRGCITEFSGHWIPVLPFRSTYATAEELMANRSDLRECVKD